MQVYYYWFILFIGITLADDGDNESCIAMGDGKENACQGPDRRFGRTKSMIYTLVCPDDENSANPACAIDAKGHTFTKRLNGALRNYGCNCYSSNKKQRNHNGKLAFAPGQNGKPIDALDKACHTLAKRFNCFNIDQFVGDISEDCHAFTAYTYHVDENGELVCGGKRNPNYEEKGDIWGNTCRLALCEMEREFAIAVANIMKDPRAFQAKFPENYKIYDTEKCVKSVNMYDSDKSECCGTHVPAGRSPYDPYMNSCCDGKVTDIFECM